MLLWVERLITNNIHSHSCHKKYSCGLSLSLGASFTQPSICILTYFISGT
ncbi:unnamed protein product [Musa textilis]